MYNTLNNESSAESVTTLNPSAGVDDLAQLEVLNEDTLVDALRQRYNDDKYYVRAIAQSIEYIVI